MVFASAVFLYVFLPAFLALYFATPLRWRNALLALASYVFYGWWRLDFLVLMWASTLTDYACGRGILADRSRGRRGRRWVLLSLTVNLGALAFFKYADFGIESLNHLLAVLGVGTLPLVEVVLPLGISFYTFQTISYTVDVYRGQAEPVRSFTDFMAYVSMFPQLVAGPIVRYHSIARQLHERRITLPGFYRGVLAFQAGLAKKVLVADVLGGVADQAFDGRVLDTADAWLGVCAYAFQIYFDFSGYSDMAIGLGLMIGFRFPINFDRPYASRSITEFWRRWHVSLSSFLRDYLYVPLGGNRHGTLRTYRNLALTMLLGGLWHGAQWTFVVWGAWHGAWLVLERALGKRAPWSRLPAALPTAATFAVVLIGWVLFRAVDLPEAGRYLSGLLGFPAGDGADRGALLIEPLHWVAGGFAAVVVWTMPTTQRLIQRARSAWVVTLQLVFLLALLHLHHEDHVPFLYFQF